MMLPASSPFTNKADIKELPHALDGTFAWLLETPTHSDWAIGDEQENELASQLASVIASAKEHGLVLPKDFVTFIGNPTLHKHVRSSNGCYLSVAESVLSFEDGFLIRFLSDQQDCMFWYIYSNSDGSDHCVVSSIDYCDADDMDDEIEDIKETDFHIWATSFEGFMSRFWIENEIFFAEEEGTPPPNVDAKFLKLYAQ